MPTGVGGTPLITSFFRGPNVGLFGGAEYHTPIQNLTLKVEYSSDDYYRETFRTGKDYGAFPVNAGLSYRFWSNVDVGLAYIQGREISLDVTVAFDAAKNNWPMRIDPLPPVTVRSEEEVEAVAAALQMQNGDFDKEPWRAHFTDMTAADNAQGASRQMQAMRRL